MSDPYVLETRNLVKEFKGFVAVNDVNLNIQKGQIHALIGPYCIFCQYCSHHKRHHNSQRVWCNPGWPGHRRPYGV